MHLCIPTTEINFSPPSPPRRKELFLYFSNCLRPTMSWPWSNMAPMISPDSQASWYTDGALSHLHMGCVVFFQELLSPQQGPHPQVIDKREIAKDYIVLTHVRHCSKHCYDSFKPHSNPMRQIYHYPHFTDEETKAQRGQVTCLRSYSHSVAGPRFTSR